ncbi:uncharacterized protein METZ01_LOCUS509466, partial [marine metagenome]
IMGTVSPDPPSGQKIQFILFRLASNLFSMGLTLGSIRIILDVIGGVETKIENLFNSFQLLFPYICGYLLFLLGILLLFIPFFRLIILNESGLRIIESFLSGDIVELVQLMEHSINLNYLFLYLLPCFYMWIKIQFFPYFIISEELGPIDSLKKSYEITEGQSTNLVLFLMLLIIINLLGLIPFGLGLLITIPFTFVATGVMFSALNN